MDLTLNRLHYENDGIFSTLLDSDGNRIAITLEHAFVQIDMHSVQPILQPGTYTCVRGMHQLTHMNTPFETFEITGVEGHTNILFHAGNFNDDSEGCVLLGENMAPYGNEEMVTNSQATFAYFMQLQEGVDTFTLTVIA